MDWLEISVFTTDEGTEAVCGALSAVGIDTVAIEESHARAMAFIRENALYWDFADESNIGVDTPCVKAYLADLPENAPLVDAVREAINALREVDTGLDMGPLNMLVRRGRDEDWENNWKQYYKPLNVGERLLVLPSWEDEPTDSGRAVLRLDPGVAFGTGAHHTTRMCLEYLEQVVTPGCTVADLGCGSGILGIAALLLGAERVAAVDIDPVAERIARENAALNGVTEAQLCVYTGDVLKDAAVRDALAGQYDVVVANIVADVIIRLAPFARTLCREGGAFVVSGVIDERADEVARRVAEAGFTLCGQNAAEGWVAMRFRG